MMGILRMCAKCSAKHFVEANKMVALEKPRRWDDMLPPCLTVCFFTVSLGGSISMGGGAEMNTTRKWLPSTGIGFLDAHLQFRGYTLQFLPLQCTHESALSLAFPQGQICSLLSYTHPRLKRCLQHRATYSAIQTNSSAGSEQMELATLRQFASSSSLDAQCLKTGIHSHPQDTEHRQSVPMMFQRNWTKNVKRTVRAFQCYQILLRKCQ